jgi:diguanylate cyclase (GGDEF)-like protein
MSSTLHREAVLLFLCLSLTSVLPQGLAQQASRGSVIVLRPSDEYVPLASGAEVLCDPDGNVTFEAAQTATYSPLQKQMLTAPACQSYWLRFSVRTDSLPVAGWVLRLSNPWRHANLYSTGDSAVATELSGNSRPPQERNLASGDSVFSLPLRPGIPECFYLQLSGETSHYGESRNLGATITRLDVWVLRQRSLLFAEGIYAGIIVGLALYNLILFLTIRERVYLYYVLYVISFGTLWIARTGFLFQYLWPLHPYWDSEYQPFVGASAIVFSVMFVRRFLSTRERSPRIDLALRGTIALTILLCLPRIVGVRMPLAVPLAVIGLAASLIYAALGLLALARGFRPARFFLLAWTALLIGNVVYIFMFLRIFPQTFFTYYSAQTGSALECTLLAFALADRVNLRKRTREAQQLEYTLRLQEEVKERTGELSDAVEKLRTASATDLLTGLSNRRHVDAAIRPWIADLQRARIRNARGETRRYLAICLGDLDHFKLINDDLGHAAGDRVLQMAAKTLRDNVRATAVLARWGGEEFLILDHVTAPFEDVLMAERLRLSLIDDNSPVLVETGRTLSLSLGVVRYPFSDDFPELLDWDQCLALADHALYRAKKSGRNRWECYRCNEAALGKAIEARGADEVRKLLRLHADGAFSLGLIEIIDRVPSDAEFV